MSTNIAKTPTSFGASVLSILFDPDTRLQTKEAIFVLLLEEIQSIEKWVDQRHDG